MKKRSIARKASVAARHGLLKGKKKRRLKKTVSRLEKSIRLKEIERTDFLEASKALKSKVAQEILGKSVVSKDLGALYFQASSDIGMEQAMLETTLKRKRKQLKSLKDRKRQRR